MNMYQSHRLPTLGALFGRVIMGASSAPSARSSVRDDRHMRPAF